MKPTLLKMIAFGPYAKQVQLDFKKELHYQDIFVITGPTGAGKTTIFDAICYALYGETSGANRKGEELCSDFSTKGDLKTEVEFTFSMKDKSYCITRAPKQKQKKKRGTGTTEVPATVQLIEIDSDCDPLTKDHEIRQEIQAILGLSVDQFRKIVMIPQGDFKEFLYANTTNKEELLRKIFGTELYKAVQAELHEKAMHLKSNVLQIQNEIAAELATLKTDEEEMLQQLMLEHSRLPIIMEAINQQIIRFKKQDVEWKQNLSRIEKSLQKINILRQEALLVNEKFEQIEKASQQLVDLEQQKPLFIAKEQELAAAVQAQELLILENEVSRQEAIWQRLNDELRQKQQQLTDVETELALVKISYAAIEEQKQELNQLIQQESQLTFYYEEVKLLNRYQKDYEELKQRRVELIKRLQHKSEQLEELGTQLLLLEGNQRECEQLKAESLDLQLIRTQTEIHLKTVHVSFEHFQLWQQLASDGERLKQQYHEMKQNLAALRRHYEDQGRLFIHAAAIRLANDLKIGQACPVCGSTEHPNPSCTQEPILTQRQLNQLREELNQLTAQEQASWQAFKSAQLKTDEAERFLMENNDLIKQQHPHLGQFPFTEKQLSELKNQLDKTAVDQTKQLNEVMIRQDKLKQKINQLLTIKEAQQKLAEEVKHLETKVQAHEVKYLTQKETLHAVLERIPKPYQQLEALTIKIKNLQIKRQDFEEKIKTTESNYQNFQSQWTVLQTTITHLDQQMKQSQMELEAANKTFQANLLESFMSNKLYQVAKKAKEVMNQLVHDIQLYQQEVHTATHLIKQLELELVGKERQNICKLEQMVVELENQKEVIRQKKMNNKMKSQHYEQILTSTMKKYDQIQHQEVQYAIVGELAELANGRTAGKMSFETYVLSSYFDEVLKAANQRLGKMTGGRYYVLRRDAVKGSGRKGLELDVYDSHTCKKRPVNTLSGGESFKASLALALGLSDTVQQNAGGIQLDTMFIDEGFGTLDSNSLEQAIDILMDLQDHGRLIGVISHVDELKNRIPAKLIVQASPDGSLAYFKK